MIGNVLIKTTSATAIDCSHIEKVTGIVIDSSEPDNTQTRYLISIDGGKWRKFSGSAWNFADTQELTPESVLSEGNTKDELMTLTETELTAFGGKMIDVVVAMQIANNADLPAINKFELIGENSQIKKDIFYSNVFILGDEAVGITDIDISKRENSGGAVELYAAVQNDANEWSDYIRYDKISGKAKAIRFKAEIEVDKPGISTAILDNVKIQHWQSSKAATIEGKGVLVTKPLVFENEVNRVHAILRHPNIKDTEFKVFVIFGDSESIKEVPHTSTYQRNGEVEEDFELFITDDDTSKTVTLKVEIIQNYGTVSDKFLGIGTGKQQAFKLEHHARPETLQIVGSNNWTFKEKTDTLLVTARTGDDIYVSYDWLDKTTYLTALACIFNS